jgi:hypothetical protein
MKLQNALQMRVHQIAMWIHTTQENEIHHPVNESKLATNILCKEIAIARGKETFTYYSLTRALLPTLGW